MNLTGRSDFDGIYILLMCICTDAGAIRHCRLHFRPVLFRTKTKGRGGTARGGGKLGEAPYVHGEEGARAAACQTTLLFPQDSNSDSLIHMHEQFYIVFGAKLAKSLSEIKGNEQGLRHFNCS